MDQSQEGTIVISFSLTVKFDEICKIRKLRDWWSLPSIGIMLDAQTEAEANKTIKWWETHVIRSTGYFCSCKIKLFDSFTFEISWHLKLFYILVIQLVTKRHGFHKDAVIHISPCQMSTLKVKKTPIWIHAGKAQFQSLHSVWHWLSICTSYSYSIQPQNINIVAVYWTKEIKLLDWTIAMTDYPSHCCRSYLPEWHGSESQMSSLRSLIIINNMSLFIYRLMKSVSR